MSPFVVSLFFTVGACTWIYVKLQKYSGNNTQQSAIATAATGVVIFLVFFFVFKAIIK